MIAEGVPVVRRLLASPYPVRAVLGVPGRLAALAADLAAVDAPVYRASAEVMAQTVGFHLNRGVLAAADRAPERPAAELLAGARRVLALEGVNDHENLGALFRNAAALGVDAVLLGPRCADPLYRRSVRVSMGHVLRVPFARAPLTALRDAGLTVLALTPRPPAVPLSTVDSALPRAALLVGAEGPGPDPGRPRGRRPARPHPDGAPASTPSTWPPPPPSPCTTSTVDDGDGAADRQRER